MYSHSSRYGPIFDYCTFVLLAILGSQQFSVLNLSPLCFSTSPTSSIPILHPFELVENACSFRQLPGETIPQELHCPIPMKSYCFHLATLCSTSYRELLHNSWFDSSWFLSTNSISSCYFPSIWKMSMPCEPFVRQRLTISFASDATQELLLRVLQSSTFHTTIPLWPSVLIFRTLWSLLAPNYEAHRVKLFSCSVIQLFPFSN